ncbi:secreted protein [gut metagenome]|uniref:Secreted protein n=1 Tax=gut metagenome TaxID=749906 RepID=J9FXC0_9ZZZZ
MKSRKVARLSAICAGVLMPLRTHMTPSSEAAKRRAQAG